MPQRALLIAQALLKEAERRGYEIKATSREQAEKPGVAIVVRGHAYQIYLAEQTDRIQTAHSRNLELAANG